MNQALKNSAFTSKFEGLLPDSKKGFSLSRHAVCTASGTYGNLSQPWLPAEWTGTWTVD